MFIWNFFLKLEMEINSLYEIFVKLGIEEYNLEKSKDSHSDLGDAGF